jgi:hypothetical protein
MQFHPHDLVATSGYYCSVSGVFAGFLFTAVVLLVGNLKPGEPSANARFSRPLASLFGAFFSMLVVSFLYSELAGDSPDDGNRMVFVRGGFVGIVFVLAALQMLHGMLVMFDSYETHDHVTSVAWAAFMGAQLIGLTFLAMLVQNAIAASSESAPICWDTSTSHLLTAMIVCASLLWLLRWCSRIPFDSARRDWSPWTCIVVTVAATFGFVVAECSSALTQASVAACMYVGCALVLVCIAFFAVGSGRPVSNRRTVGGPGGDGAPAVVPRPLTPFSPSERPNGVALGGALLPKGSRSLPYSLHLRRDVPGEVRRG